MHYCTPRSAVADLEITTRSLPRRRPISKGPRITTSSRAGIEPISPLTPPTEQRRHVKGNDTVYWADDRERDQTTSAVFLDDHRYRDVAAASAANGSVPHSNDRPQAMVDRSLQYPLILHVHGLTFRTVKTDWPGGSRCARILIAVEVSRGIRIKRLRHAKILRAASIRATMLSLLYQFDPEVLETAFLRTDSRSSNQVYSLGQRQFENTPPQR